MIMCTLTVLVENMLYQNLLFCYSIVEEFWQIYTMPIDYVDINGSIRFGGGDVSCSVNKSVVSGTGLPPSKLIKYTIQQP